jgi:hypothetical protein
MRPCVDGCFQPDAVADRKSNRMCTSTAHVWSIASLRTGAYLGGCSVPVARDFLACPVLGGDRHSPAPQRWPNRCCHPLPTDALIDLKVRCRLGTATGTPRRCGRSTPPTGSERGAWVAPAWPGLGVDCLPQVPLAHTRAEWLGTHLRRLRRCVLCQRHRRCPVRRVRCHRRCATRTQTFAARVIAR